jgi:hypothetical protein
MAMACIPVLFLYLHNIDQMLFRDTVIPTLLSMGFAALLWIGLIPLVGKGSAAALITSLFVTLFHSYGHAFVLFQGFSIGNVVLGRNRYLIPAWLLILAVGSIAVLRIRDKKQVDAVSLHVDRIALTILCLLLAQIAFFQVKMAVQGVSGGSVASAARPASYSTQPVSPVPARANLPDIYYIIPDAHDAGSTLKDVFNYDNGDFEDFLKKKGFYVADKSTSNYAFTTLSLASSLNMRLLDSLGSSLGESSMDENTPGHMIIDNAVMAFLKTKGYTLVNTGSWWGPTIMNQNADINNRTVLINEFTMKLIECSALVLMVDAIVQNDLRDKVHRAFAKLAEIPKLKEPTFTLVHILCPHPPFIFGRDGEKVAPLRRALNKSNPKALYLDQLIYMDKLLRQAVTTILAESKTPPVIIIQGDHGSAFIRNNRAFTKVMPDKAYLREQMRILNAYYLPGVDTAGLLYKEITPVNSFRVVFNAYFDAKLPLLEDKNTYSSHARPYAFSNVTATVRYDGSDAESDSRVPVSMGSGIK